MTFLRRRHHARDWALAALAFVLLPAVLGACGRTDSGTESSGPPSVAEAPRSAPSVQAAGPVRVGDWTFTACSTTAAEEADTDLRPRTITAAPGEHAIEYSPGVFRVVSGPDLPLPTGEVLAASPPGLYMRPVDATRARVADSAVVAKTSIGLLAVEGGSQVAFVELKLPGGPPVRWEASELGIGTDGGDGGFAPPGDWLAVPEELWEPFVRAQIAVGLAPDHPPCLTVGRANAEERALFFNTGGDGGYPVWLGRDANGKIVAVVYDGMIVPWQLSGLPGEPPESPDSETERADP